MSREWERALERQLALIDYTKTGSASVWFDLFTRLYRDMMAPEALRARTASLLNTAETFYVSEEMTKLVEVASESIGNPVLLPHVPFVPRGFVYFQRPIRISSFVAPVEGQRLVESLLDIRAMLWTYEPASVVRKSEDGSYGEPGPGVNLFLFGGDTQLDHYVRWMTGEDPDPVELARVTGTDIPTWHETLRSLMRHFGVDQFHAAPGGLTLIEAQSWAEGVEWKEFDDELQEKWIAHGEALPANFPELEWSGQVWFSVARVRRLLYALWSLMAQPIAAPRTEQANRDYRRRWERTVGATPNYGDVRVVTLRRAMSGGGPEESDDVFGREWSHRWVVRGHWREQWYPSEGVHRLIWIAPFVKGPVDKPLIVKDTVFSVVR